MSTTPPGVSARVGTRRDSPSTAGTDVPGQAAVVEDFPRQGASTEAAPAAVEPLSASSDDGAQSPLQSAISVITTIGPPLTIVTALMIYFGWARSDTQARLMGLDVSLFGFSTQDFVLQSISTLYVPLLTIAALALGVLALHRRVDDALRRPPSRPTLRLAGRLGCGIGLAVAVVALVVAMQPASRGSLLVPLVLAAGVSVAGYGGWLAGAAAGPGTVPTPRQPPRERALRKLLLGSVITLALFWEVSNYAGVVGRGYAQQLEVAVPRLPQATAFSAGPLGIEAPGVREEEIRTSARADGDPVRYRTTGLRFLVRSGGRLFLLHDGWTTRNGTVVVLPDNEQIRWQFSR